MVAYKAIAINLYGGVPKWLQSLLLTKVPLNSACSKNWVTVIVG